MPKKFRNLYGSICSFENLYSAYLKARRGKRYSPDCLTFSAHLERNLIELRRELSELTYHTGEYRFFTVYEPKEREIAALPFRDRVVHHALMNVIGPIFEPRFYEHSYACRPEKGTHRGVDYLQRCLRIVARSGPVCFLKCDVRHYFPSIRHDILLDQLWRHIDCNLTRWLITEIIESTGTTGEDGMQRGLPIGNLTSQSFANVYLAPLDQFIKHELRVRWYIRYVDDWIIVGNGRVELQQFKKIIAEFIADNLDLQLHPKSNVMPIAQGVNFLGYRIWPTHRLLRKSSVVRMRRKLKVLKKKYHAGELSFNEVNPIVQSWIGHAGHANTYNLRKRLFNEFVL